MNEEHKKELIVAKGLLEKTPFVMKATDVIGAPIEKGLERLPQDWQEKILLLTNKSLQKSLEWGLKSMDADSITSYPKLHMAAAALSGGIGGAFGLPALALELPISTTIMLRSVADIAKANGEDLALPEVRLECINVFSLGGVSKNDDALDSAYYAIRGSMASAIGEASKYIVAHKGQKIALDGAPALIHFLSRVAARFNMQVSEKALAQLVPVVGAAGGAIINTLFIDHFQNVSRGHFTVRRLEREYGVDEVQAAYAAIALD